MEFYIGKDLEGDLAQTEPDVFNLSNGGVDITDMSVIAKYVTDKDKLEELKGIIEQCRKWIADGTITVFDARMASIENDGQRLDDWLKIDGNNKTYAELNK